MVVAYLVHGWDGYPDNCWFPWLEDQLHKLGVDVHILMMPHPDEPVIEEWVRYLQNTVEEGEDPVFIGHSVGCQAILRFMEKESVSVKAVFLVAPWVNLKEESFESDEERAIAQPWIETPLNWKKIRSLSEHFIALFSDDDFCVPVSDAEIFEQELGAKVLILENKGHFDDEADILKLPELLDEIKNILS